MTSDRVVQPKRAGSTRAPAILCVAPGWSPGGDPWDLEELREDLLSCVEAGASMIHLHLGSVRQGRRDPAEVLADLVSSLRPSGVVLEGSTGMVGISPGVEERCGILAVPGWDLVSLNMGTVNFGRDVFYNPLPLIEEVADRISAYGAKPDLEVFELGMVETVKDLRARGRLAADRPVINITLGVGGTTLSASTENLLRFSKVLPPGSCWGFVHNDMPDMLELVSSLSFGASFIRVGFENARYIDDGTVPRRNLEFVERASALLRSLNVPRAAPAEARAAFGLPG